MECRSGEQDAPGKAARGQVGERERCAQGADVPPVGRDGGCGCPRGAGPCGTCRRPALDGHRPAVRAHHQSPPMPGLDRECPRASLSEQDFTGGTVSDGAEDHPAAVHQGDVHGEERDAGREIPRPADGVDKPVRSGWIGDTAELLTDDGEVDDLGEHRPHRLLDGDVGGRDQIPSTLEAELVGPDSATGQRKAQLDRPQGSGCLREEAGRHGGRGLIGRAGRAVRVPIACLRLRELGALRHTPPPAPRDRGRGRHPQPPGFLR